MVTIKNALLSLGITISSLTCFSQYEKLNSDKIFKPKLENFNLHLLENQSAITNKHQFFGHSSTPVNQPQLNLNFSSQEKEPFFSNKRNLYSSLWGYASLNYLYADLVGLMDANVLAQYQRGVVNDMKITPQFLTVASGFMQIPIANVFLPHIIKNEKTLRWVQIASGSIMTLVQSATLFVGKPTPYYALFSSFEIAATTYITIDAIKWKPNSKRSKRQVY